MIAGIWHQGSGIGNQLFRYVAARTLAEDKGCEFGMCNPDWFKGDFFLDFDKGISAAMEVDTKYWEEKKVVENGIDIRSYDPEINFVQDNTIIDGEFQDARYWQHKLPQINKWLTVEPLDVPNDVCVIGFRGGDYYADPNLGLPTSYFDKAISEILHMNSHMRFEVHTDDPQLAAQFFSNIPIIPNDRMSHSNHSNMGYNWRAMRYAKYAIIANSSFYILPRLLSRGVTIAPRYWARRNVGVWALPQNYYSCFSYI